MCALRCTCVICDIHMYLFVNSFPLWFVEWSPPSPGSRPIGMHETSARDTTAACLQGGTDILRVNGGVCVCVYVCVCICVCGIVVWEWMYVVGGYVHV